MNKEAFIKLAENGPILLDGAMGTNLILAGMPRGSCSEAWILDHPDVVRDLQSAYVKAGSQIVYAPTFSANRVSMDNMGMASQVERFNREIPALTRSVIGPDVLMAGDMTTCGRMLEPKGKQSHEELFAAYAEQARLLTEAGCDLLIGETLLCEDEALVLLDAAASVTDLAVMISFTVEGDGTMPFGGYVMDAAPNVEHMGAAAVGINCSMGPDQAAAVIRMLRERVSIPVIAKLNAGLPEIDDAGNVNYNIGPEDFKKYMGLLMDAGASVIGGCCGTTPAYIEGLRDLILEKAR